LSAKEKLGGSAPISPKRTSTPSLTLILHLASALHSLAQEDLTERVFRAATYSAVLPGGVPWEAPSALEATRHTWAIYERNDLLSVVMQSIFVACLDALASLEAFDQRSLSTVEAFAAALAANNSAKAGYASLNAALISQTRREIDSHRDSPTIVPAV
jgi:hypothetical protein